MSLGSSGRLRDPKLKSACGVLTNVTSAITTSLDSSSCPGIDGETRVFNGMEKMGDTSSYYVIEGHSLASRRRWVAVINPRHLARPSILPMIGRVVKLRCLDKGQFTYKQGPDGLKRSKLIAFRSTSKTQVSVQSKAGPACQDVLEPCSDDKKENGVFFHHQGVVTDARCAHHGIYTINKRVTLILPHYPLLVDSPVLVKGESVQIVNGHCLQDEEVDHKVILCCAKTTLLHSGSQSSQSTQENPPFATDATAGFHMDPHQMWALLLSAQSWLAANSRGNSLRDFFDSPGLLKLALTQLGLKEKPSFVLDEIASFPHRCCVITPGKRLMLPSHIDFWSVEGFKNHLKAKTSSQVVSEIPPGLLTRERQLVGELKLFKGTLQVCDSTGSITIAPIMSQRYGKFVGEKVRVAELTTICKDFVSRDTTLTYAFGTLARLDPSPKTLAPTRCDASHPEQQSWRVLFKSGVITSNDDDQGGGDEWVYLSAREIRAAQTELPRINTLLQVNVAKFPRIVDAKTGTTLYTSSTEATKQKSLSFDGIQGSRDVISAEVVDSRDSDSLEDTASAYSLDELGYIECSELVNVLATVRERWIEVDKFKDDDGNGSPIEALKGSILHIKFGSQGCDDLVSLYVTRWRCPSFPLGLVAGANICATNVVKKVSTQGRPYLKATLFTEFKLVDRPDPRAQLTTLSQLAAATARNPSGKHPTARLVVTPLEVIKLHLTSVCKACQTPVSEELRCNYVGCGYSSGNATFSSECSATLSLQDDTRQATAFINNTQVLRTMLDITSEEWQHLARTTNCLSYSAQHQHSGIFSQYCDTLYSVTYLRFECTVRPLKNEGKGLKFVIIDAVKTK